MSHPQPESSAPIGAEVLVAATIRAWVAEELRAGAAGRIEVRHDFGLDLPVIATTTAWWTPAEHAARLLRAGAGLELSAPGPAWLSRVPEELSGRPVWSGTLSQLGEAPRAGYAKAAEAKVEGLPAAWWDDTGDFAAAAAAAGLGPDAWVQVSPRLLSIAEEHRCYVAEGEVVATSPYLLADGSTYEEGWEARADLDHAGARGFASEATAALGADQPPAYVLDVARLDDGSWVVLEANPAWCSGFYGCELGAVVEVVVASSVTPAPGGPVRASLHGAWAWRPDPVLVAYAEGRALLRPYEPAWARIARESGGS